MYSYDMIEESLLIQIYYNDVLIDQIGPWESAESAVSWAELYVAKKNAGLTEPETL